MAIAGKPCILLTFRCYLFNSATLLEKCLYDMQLKGPSSFIGQNWNESIAAGTYAIINKFTNEQMQFITYS